MLLATLVIQHIVGFPNFFQVYILIIDRSEPESSCSLKLLLRMLTCTSDLLFRPSDSVVLVTLKLLFFFIFSLQCVQFCGLSFLLLRHFHSIREILIPMKCNMDLASQFFFFSFLWRIFFFHRWHATFLMFLESWRTLTNISQSSVICWRVKFGSFSNLFRTLLRI